MPASMLGFLVVFWCRHCEVILISERMLSLWTFLVSYISIVFLHCKYRSFIQFYSEWLCAGLECYGARCEWCCCDLSSHSFIVLVYMYVEVIGILPILSTFDYIVGWHLLVFWYRFRLRICIRLRICWHVNYGSIVGNCCTIGLS